MVDRFTGRVVLVTGAGRGIGRAIARRFAAEGAAVALADIDAEAARATAGQVVGGGGKALGIGADVSDGDAVQALFAQVEAGLGNVDVLVNNAADVSGQRHFLETDQAWWDHVLATNLTSQFLCARRAAPSMVARRRGAIINVSSGGATKAHRGMLAYDASKGGSEALTRALALELAPYGIRVNTLVPGFIATRDGDPAQRALRDATVPLGRGGTAEDLAGPALFLASDDAAYITGTRLVVDGGVLVQQRPPQVEIFPLSNFPAGGPPQ